MRKALLAAACFTLFASPIYAQTPVLNPVTPLTGTAGPNGSATPVSPTNPLPISGSFSATLSGFTPNGLYASLTATASTSTSTAIPTGSTTVRITNLGAGTVSCTFATGAATGLVNNTQVGPSSSVSRAVGAFDHLACIDQTGSSGSQLVIIEGGAGLGNDTGGGGGGSGGAVTLASAAAVDCWSVTGGCKADGPATLPATTTPVTDMAIQKAIANAANTIATNSALPLPAQSNHTTNIGVADIGQSTQGTTNGVTNGANNTNTVAASASAFVLSATQGGGTGATGDYLSHCVIQPGTTSPGAVTIADNATTIFSFAGGASSVSNLLPMPIPFGAVSKSGGWKVTSGTNVTLFCVGKFS